ncbi:hypothetical protein E8E14_010302 [Neopestalotiopsis sp. 37M]|nr:hypothetical protein E8E14_010302 [Neopestalotiopsis sp. 37M]
MPVMAEQEQEKSPATMEGSALLALPVDMIYLITDFLSIGGMKRLAFTCKDMRRVVESEMFRRDRNTGLYRTLQWAALTQKKRAIIVIKRSIKLWPNGIKDLEVHFTQGRVAKIHGKTLRHKTPLLAAIIAGNIDVVAYLLAEGANVHQTDMGNRESRWSPIHWAVMMDYQQGETQQSEPPRTKLGIIELLLVHGANPNQLSAPNPNRLASLSLSIISPMHLAIINGANHHVIELLIRYGGVTIRTPCPDVPEQHYCNISPISHLTNAYLNPTENHCSSLRALAIHGGGSNGEAHSHTLTGHPLLLEFLSNPKESSQAVDFVRIMLKYTQAGIKDTTVSGDTAMVHFLKSHVHWRPAMAYDRRQITSHEVQRSMAMIAGITCSILGKLVERGANINSYGEGRVTPLHVACGLHCHFSSVFDYLYTQGADVKARTSRGRNLLHSLVLGDAEADFTLITPFIQKLNIKRYAKDNDGNTFLHLLVTRRLTLFGKWMSQAAKHYKRTDFENPKYRNNAGRTPLEEASFSSEGNGEATRFWIRHAFDEREEYLAAKRKPTKAAEQTSSPESYGWEPTEDEDIWK